MSPERDFEGLRAPESRERVRLLADVSQYLESWQRALGTGRPGPQQIAQLNQRAGELQGRALGAGFGSLGQQIAEYARLLAAGADLPSMRGQLGVISDSLWQARQTLAPGDRDADPGRPVAPGWAGGKDLAMPPMITVARPPSTAPSAASKTALQERAPATHVQAPAARPAPSAAWEPKAPVAPPLERPPPANPAPQFGVKNMLGLRAFGKSPPQPQVSRPSNPSGPLLALPVLGREGAARASAPPPFVSADPSGLPRLEPSAPVRDAAARQADEIRQRLSQEPRGLEPPARRSSQERAHPSSRAADARPGSRKAARSSAPPPKGDPRRPNLRGRPESGANRVGLWVAIGGASLLVALGLVAFFVLTGHRRRSSVDSSTRGVSSAPLAIDSSAAGRPKGEAEMPRERLLVDNERFASLIAQVHGHGGTESPELRSLLNDQAALASKALAGKCQDGSPTCKTIAGIRELLVGDRAPPLARRRRGSDTETTRSQWMAGLKLPGVPVEDDPRVLRVFEFYTENPVGRETFQSMLFRCGAYRDLIQSTLIRYNLPPDLLALVFTESGCEPSAKSPVGAAGLWQFMPETGRAYHLNVIEGAIDERYSPFKSTEAGIRMLSDLRQKLGSWDLVFASYDLGPFGLLARLEKAGGDVSFWDLVDADLLPDETANYAPTVEAIALILANLQRLKFAGIQIRAPQMTADLDVPGGTRLGLVARAAATSVTQLRALNLDFSGDLVPVIPGGSVAVQVPKDVVWQARDSITELLASKDGADQCVSPAFDWGKQRFTPEMDSACQRRLGAGLGAARPDAR